MKDVFKKFDEVGVSDAHAARLLGLSYYAVRVARTDSPNCRLEVAEKLKALAVEVDKLVKAAAKIANS